jgi:predicted transcriptional regulator
MPFKRTSSIGFVPRWNFIAFEDISAGDFVNIIEEDGQAMVRKADASKKIAAHGFVENEAPKGNKIDVCFFGINQDLRGLSLGSTYFLSATPGKCDVTPSEVGSGNIAQELGFAITSSCLVFRPGADIQL